MQEKISIISGILGRSHRTGVEHLFRCPYCKHHKHKFSVNIEKNVYKCWLCDARGRDLYRIVRRFGTFSDLESWKEVSGDRLDLNEFDCMFEIPIQDSPREQIVAMPKGFKTLTSTEHAISAKRPLQYLRDRGIGKLDILKWKIGYCTEGRYRNRIIVPSFNESGNLNYFVARSYTDSHIRYMNPPASRNIIFNELYVDFEKEVTIVEGIFDAINSTNAIPILGSSIREDSMLFRKIIKHDTPVLLALDPDAERKSNAIKNLFLKYAIEVRELRYTDKRDIGEMSKDEVKNLSINAPFVKSYDSLLSAISAI
jgi:DNA primase